MPTIEEVVETAESKDSTASKNSTDSNDNVEPAEKPAEKPTEPADMPRPSQLMYSASDAKKLLEKHYKTTYEKLSLKFADQITDNSRIEFVNPANNETIATGRLRFTNTLHLTPEGKMYVEAHISDMSQGNATLPI